MPDDEAELTRWAAVLDELERDLETDASEPFTDAGAPAWSIPPELGPMPDDLVARARRIAERQHSTIVELQSTRRVIGRHLNAVRSVPPASATGESVYLDVAG